jgi:prophage antirepressor-like protein
MNELQIFNFEGKDIRTVIVDNQPWFVGKDLADVLGYSNPQKALRDHIDDEDKTVNESFSVNGTKVILVNESGLYSLILKSQLPGARQFKRWVTSEVLPSISKHGAYLTEDVMVKTLNDPNYIIGLIQAIAASRVEISAKNQIIGEL